MHVEEAAAVIELDLPRWGQPRQSKADLLGDCAGWNAFSECVAPQIAHQASPGTLSIGEKDGRDRDDFARGCTLVLNEKRIRPPRIQNMALRPFTENPAISLRNGSSDMRDGLAIIIDNGTETAFVFRFSEGQCPRMVCSAMAPCWKRRLGKTGIFRPVRLSTPCDTISPLSSYSRSTL